MYIAFAHAQGATDVKATGSVRFLHFFITHTVVTQQPSRLRDTDDVRASGKRLRMRVIPHARSGLSTQLLCPRRPGKNKALVQLWYQESVYFNPNIPDICRRAPYIGGSRLTGL